MSAPTCGRCDATTGDDAHLCWPCTWRTRDQLRDTPSLLAELARTRWRQSKVATVAGLGGGRCEHGAGEDCGCGVVLPWSEHAADRAAYLRNAVATWTRCLLDDTGRDDSAVTGHPSTWLADHIRDIRTKAWAVDASADIDRCYRAARAAVDRPDDRMCVGTCGAQLASGGTCKWVLWAIAGSATVTCQGCRTEHDATARRETMIESSRHELYTATQCAQALTTVEIPVTPGLISKWAHRLVQGRPKLPIAGYTTDGRPLYRLGDVRDVARGVPLRDQSRRDDPLSSSVCSAG